MTDHLPQEPPPPLSIEDVLNGVGSPQSAPLAPSPTQVSTKGRDRVEGARSPSTFYVPAPTSKDSERISVRVDAATLAHAMRLIETRVFGWESFSDFCRWAVFRGVQEGAAALGDETLSNEVRVLAAMQKRVQQQHREAEFAAGLAQVKGQITSLMQQDAMGDALVLYREILADAEALTISRFKHRFISDLRASFPVLEAEVQKEDLAR